MPLLGQSQGEYPAVALGVGQLPRIRGFDLWKAVNRRGNRRAAGPVRDELVHVEGAQTVAWSYPAVGAIAHGATAESGEPTTQGTMCCRRWVDPRRILGIRYRVGLMLASPG